ncbi:hypothetical protein MNBD_BACTEROID01-1323, partial [hydrothermal vent metagenome]
CFVVNIFMIMDISDKITKNKIQTAS